jgi:hypothetical protein
MKNVNVQLSFLIRDIRAGGKGNMPPYFGNIEAYIQMIFFSLFFFAYQF